MNDEIKEILDNIEVNELKHHKWYCSVEKDNMQKILDYITNLQQEIEKLNDDKRDMLVQLYKANDNRDKVKQENERLKEEKQRLLYNLEKVCEEDATTNN